jgi:L-asparaginase
MLADRVVKVSSVALDAFHEVPRQEPSLGDVAAESGRGEEARYGGNLRIGVVTLIPGLTAEALDGALAPLEGAVLRCYGSGTLPSDPAFQSVLERRVHHGLVIIAVSQCEHGGIRPGEYAASWALREAGVIDGGALTTEAAFARLALLLSKQATKEAK